MKRSFEAVCPCDKRTMIHFLGHQLRSTDSCHFHFSTLSFASVSLQRIDCIDVNMLSLAITNIKKRSYNLKGNHQQIYSISVLVHYTRFGVHLVLYICQPLYKNIYHSLSIYTQQYQSTNSTSRNKQFAYKNICGKLKISTFTCWNNLNPPEIFKLCILDQKECKTALCIRCVQSLNREVLYRHLHSFGVRKETEHALDESEDHDC